MSTQLDEYSIEYVESNGTYLKLQKNQNEGFKQDDFQELQLKMIQSNHFPRLLPMSFEDINNRISVFYKIEGLRKLRSLTKEHPPTMQEYYALFINLIQALQDSNNNMLTDRHFVLNEENIYIGNGYHDVNLIYLPLKQSEENSSVYESLKQLLLNMASEVKGLNGTQFKMILNYIKDPGFSLQGIKQLLSKLQDKQQEHAAEEDNQEEENHQEEYKTKKIRRMPPLNRKLKLYSVLIGVLLLAVVWNFYDGSPSPFMFTLSIILSLAVIGGVVVYWFVWRPGVEPIITEKEVKVKKKQNKPKQTRERKAKAASSNEWQPEKQKQESNQLTETGFALPQQESASTIDSTTGNNAIPEKPQTQVYDETMLLDESEMVSESKLRKAQNYLLVDREGTEERMELDEDNFVIGRAEKGTNFVENSIGVSRMHIEFIKLSDTYGIKDLGAKNGTYINQEKIIPYKIYELEDEDEVQIGKTIYTYRVVYD
ncbi:DUF6382 domain-containing protein [Virgibacillus oceani]